MSQCTATRWSITVVPTISEQRHAHFACSQGCPSPGLIQTLSRQMAMGCCSRSKIARAP
nr:hypothetical protein [Deltaproteobacteria bacterium]